MPPSQPNQKSYNPLNRLYGQDAKTPMQRAAVKLGGISIVLVIASQFLFEFSGQAKAKHLSTGGLTLLVIYFAGWFVLSVSLLYVGVVVTGRAAGRKSFLASLSYVILKTTLYIFLPCGLITAAFIAAMYFTGRL